MPIRFRPICPLLDVFVRLVATPQISHNATMSDERGPLVDKREFGRRTRAARILAQCDSVADGVALIEQRVGHKISARQMYSLERGEITPSLEQYLAVIWGYEPPGSTAFFAPIIRPDILEKYLASLDVDVAETRRKWH